MKLVLQRSKRKTKLGCKHTIEKNELYLKRTIRGKNFDRVLCFCHKCAEKELGYYVEYLEKEIERIHILESILKTPILKEDVLNET